MNSPWPIYSGKDGLRRLKAKKNKSDTGCPEGADFMNGRGSPCVTLYRLTTPMSVGIGTNFLGIFPHKRAIPVIHGNMVVF